MHHGSARRLATRYPLAATCYASGFTLIELMIVLAISAVLVGGAVSLFHGSADKELENDVNAIVFTLEQAKGDALAGLYGKPHGVHFAAKSYTSFAGASLASGDHTTAYTIAAPFTITTSITGGGNEIVFKRLTGDAVAAGTITLTDTSDASRTARITVGAQGDISVVQ